MTNRQFSFSFSVGIALAVLGALVLTKATVGLSLMVLGAAIATLALLTRGTQEQQAKVPAMQAGDFQGPAADY